MKTVLAVTLLAGAAGAQAPAELSRTPWQLVEAKGTAFALPTERAVTLIFQGGRVSARGCNTMSGEAAFDGATLRVPGMISTQMACLGDLMKVDRVFADLLSEATYRLDGDRLTLTGKNGAVWTFARQGSPTPQAAFGGLPDVLDQTKWRLVRVLNASVSVPSQPPAALTFERGRVVAQACNAAMGRPAFEGGTIRVETAATTRKACPEDLMKVDAALAALLKEAAYSAEANRLTLRSPDGAEWVFEKLPYPSKNARTKFIYVAAETKECTGVGRMTCLQIRDSKDEPWRLNYTPIIGFEHKPGVEYRLRIKEDIFENAPADGSRYRWYLDLIVEQRLVKP
jgi:heat shock protein HslJ